MNNKNYKESHLRQDDEGFLLGEQTFLQTAIEIWSDIQDKITDIHGLLKDSNRRLRDSERSRVASPAEKRKEGYKPQKIFTATPKNRQERPTKEAVQKQDKRSLEVSTPKVEVKAELKGVPSFKLEGSATQNDISEGKIKVSGDKNELPPGLPKRKGHPVNLERDAQGRFLSRQKPLTPSTPQTNVQPSEGMPDEFAGEQPESRFDKEKAFEFAREVGDRIGNVAAVAEEQVDNDPAIQAIEEVFTPIKRGWDALLGDGGLFRRFFVFDRGEEKEQELKAKEAETRRLLAQNQVQQGNEIDNLKTALSKKPGSYIDEKQKDQSSQDIKKSTEETKESLKKFGQTIKEKLTEGYQQTKESLKKLGQDIGEKFREKFEEFKEKIKDILHPVEKTLEQQDENYYTTESILRRHEGNFLAYKDEASLFRSQVKHLLQQILEQLGWQAPRVKSFFEKLLDAIKLAGALTTTAGMGALVGVKGGSFGDMLRAMGAWWGRRGIQYEALYGTSKTYLGVAGKVSSKNMILGALIATIGDYLSIIKNEFSDKTDKEKRESRFELGGQALGSLGGVMAIAKGSAVVGAGIGSLFGPGVGTVLGTIVGWVVGAIGAYFFEPFFRKIGGWLGKVAEKITRPFSSLYSGADTAAGKSTSTFDELKRIWTELKREFYILVGAGLTVYEYIRDRVLTLCNAIIDTFEWLGKAILGIFNKIGEALDNVPWMKGTSKKIKESTGVSEKSIEAKTAEYRKKLLPESVNNWLDEKIQKLYAKGFNAVHGEGAYQRTEGEGRLGIVSKQYESKNVDDIRRNDGKTGANSYGPHQLSGRTKDGTGVNSTMYKFVEQYYKDYFSKDGKIINVNSEEFVKLWKALVNSNPEAYKANEHDFLMNTHYLPLVGDLESTPETAGIGKRSLAIQEMLYSTAIQYGRGGKTSKAGAYHLIVDALKEKGKTLNQLTDEEIIDIVQDYKKKYVNVHFPNQNQGTRDSVVKRADNERVELKKYLNKAYIEYVPLPSKETKALPPKQDAKSTEPSKVLKSEPTSSQQSVVVGANRPSVMVTAPTIVIKNADQKREELAKNGQLIGTKVPEAPKAEEPKTENKTESASTTAPSTDDTIAYALRADNEATGYLEEEEGVPTQTPQPSASTPSPSVSKPEENKTPDNPKSSALSPEMQKRLEEAQKFKTPEGEEPNLIDYTNLEEYRQRDNLLLPILFSTFTPFQTPQDTLLNLGLGFSSSVMMSNLPTSVVTTQSPSNLEKPNASKVEKAPEFKVPMASGDLKGKTVTVRMEDMIGRDIDDMRIAHVTSGGVSMFYLK